VAAIEKLLDVESSGLIPQRVREKDNSVYITFPDPADVSKATSVLKKRAETARIFKTVSQLDVFYPAVALFVDVSDLDRLKTELEHRNPSFKNKIQSLKPVYTKPNASTGHVKIFFRTKIARDEALRKGRVFVFDTSHRIVEVDLNREVRRCFNCQRYGHTQHNCKALFPACGKCADKHRTKECNASKDDWKCVGCSGGHQSGHRDCPEQIKAIARYRTFLDH
jgi:hypothetical protein